MTGASIVRRSCIAMFIAALWMPSVSFGFQLIPESGQAAPAADDSFSPRGPYYGKLEIPEIVRFDELPLRMHLEPSLIPPKIVHVLDERLVPLFTRALRDAKDLELRTVAAMSLSRVAQQEGLSIESAGDQILSTLKSSKDPAVLFATAAAAAHGNIAQAAPELVVLAKSGNDAQRLVIEPALVRWKAVEARELWAARLADPTCSEAVFRLAAEGMAALNDTASVVPLSDLVANEAVPFSKRLAAAKAIASLDPAKGLSLANTLVKGSIPDRLLSLELLDSTLPDAWALAATLCPDSSNAVASNSWQLVLRRKPELLLSHLPNGRIHADSVVRVSAARAMKLFPTPERCQWLNELLDDSHLHVRNVARQMLVDVAIAEAPLFGQIVGEAVDNLRMENKNWQGIEQALVLLGQVRASQYSALCYPLLNYPRDEVAVTAAWMIHLFPDDTLRAQLLTVVQDIEKQIIDANSFESGNILKQQHLIQAAALLRIQEILPLLEPKFSKTAPGGYLERAAALWAVGMLFEKNPDASMVKKLEERIEDRGSVPPEFYPVRRSCVMALGLMRAKSSMEVLKGAYEIDPGSELIPGTSRFVQGVLGEEIPPPVPDYRQPLGGWKINPTGS